jgi:hypothetical protein
LTQAKIIWGRRLRASLHRFFRLMEKGLGNACGAVRAASFQLSALFLGMTKMARQNA